MAARSSRTSRMFLDATSKIRSASSTTSRTRTAAGSPRSQCLPLGLISCSRLGLICESAADSRTQIMPEGINRQWLLAKRPEGPPGDQHFRWAETPVPSPGPGQALVQNLWLSLDPTMLLYAADDSERPLIPIGRPMRSIAVSRVVESRRPGIEPGEVVHGLFGWEDYSLTDDVG